MEVQKFTQFGTFSVWIFIPLTIFFVIMTVIHSTGDSPEFYIYLTLCFLMLFCLLSFYKIIISIDENTVSFKLGIGIIKRSYSLSRIKSCKPVKNSIIAGIGIRLISNGWLYNVSGLHAIELSFTDRSSVVRIGTDKPKEVSEAINRSHQKLMAN